MVNLVILCGDLNIVPGILNVPILYETLVVFPVYSCVLLQVTKSEYGRPR